MAGRTMWMLTVAVVAVVAIGGCGESSDDSSSDSRDTLPTKSEFIKLANAACAKERAGLMARVSEFEKRREGRKPLPGADMVHFVYLPTMERQIWRIEQLGVPRGETGRIDALLDAERFAVDAVAVMDRVPKLAAAERQFAEADKLFRKYGLTACANGNDA